MNVREKARGETRCDSFCERERKDLIPLPPLDQARVRCESSCEHPIIAYLELCHDGVDGRIVENLQSCWEHDRHLHEGRKDSGPS